MHSLDLPTTQLNYSIGVHRHCLCKAPIMPNGHGRSKTPRASSKHKSCKNSLWMKINHFFHDFYRVKLAQKFSPAQTSKQSHTATCTGYSPCLPRSPPSPASSPGPWIHSFSSIKHIYLRYPSELSPSDLKVLAWVVRGLERVTRKPPVKKERVSGELIF